MSEQARWQPVSRRTPPLGVGGVTLLMLVTLVLTTSPALGRSRQLGTVEQSRSLALQERTAPTQRAEPRSGRRELANRQIRPAGSGSILSLAQRPRTPLVPIAARAEATPVAQSPTDRMGPLLLNLPPPRA